MITSQTLGTASHPVSAGGRRVDSAVALIRAAAVRRKSEPDLALLREHAQDGEGVEALIAAVL